MLGCKYFVSTSYSLESHEEWCGLRNFTSCNFFSLLATIFDDIKVVPLKTPRVLKFVPGMQDRLDLITYPILCNGYRFSLVDPHFLIVLLIFMKMQMRSFSYGTRSISSSYDITGSIKSVTTTV